MASTRPLHTVLGANGAIGKALVRQLQGQHQEIALRTVSRSLASPCSDHVRASVLDREALIAACAGSAVVYLVVGLEYNRKVWKRDWPALIDNVLEACKQAHAVLVFADNLYAYGDCGDVALSATLPYTTSNKSVKSHVRANVARAICVSPVTYAIVRASDFYGPEAASVSHFSDYVVPNLLAGKTAKFAVDPLRFKHSITFTEDFARALVIAGTDSRAWGHAWHVPCAPARTFAEYCNIIADIVREEGGPAPPQPVAARLMPPMVQTLLTPLMPFFGELKDMRHVWDRDYIVDATSFTEHFGDKFGEPTELRVGFKALVAEYKRQGAGVGGSVLTNTLAKSLDLVNNERSATHAESL